MSEMRLNAEIRTSIDTFENCELSSADTVSAVTTCTHDPLNSALVFDCQLASGKAAKVIFRACVPGIFRLSMGFDDVAATEWNSIFSRTSWETMDTAFQEDEESYRLSAPGYTAVFSKSGWRYSILDSNGRAIFDTQRADKDCIGDYDNAPLGYCSLYDREGEFSCEAVVLTADEQFYGFGERFEEVGKRGKVEVTMANAPLGSVPKVCYKPVPFYFSTRGYGLFLNTGAISVFDMGVRSCQAVAIVCPGTRLDYYVFAAPTPSDALRAYCEITGYPGVPPTWALGYNQASAEVRNENGKHYYGYDNQAKVLEVAREMRKRRIPCDSITLDAGWCEDPSQGDYNYSFNRRFPDPEGMIRELKALGFHLLVWEWPYMKPHYSAFEEAKERGLLVKDSEGQPAMAYHDGTYCIDFSNPEAAAWVAAKNKALLEMGVDGFMTDFAELAPVSGSYHDASLGGSAHNVYPLLYQRTVYDACIEAKGEGVLWARSGFASMQRTPGHWAGDNASTFESMGSVVRAGINAGLSGIPFWGHDIAGWFGERIPNKTAWQPPTPELFVRWAQFGFFSPMLRSHGGSAREPWQFGEEAEQIFRKYGLLRQYLMPYIERIAAEAGRTGIPLIRAMILEFPEDIACKALDQQYMFGPDFLVAPVCNEVGTVAAYLPAGSWQDLWTGEIVGGPCSLHLTMPLDRMPIYIRESSPYYGKSAEILDSIS